MDAGEETDGRAARAQRRRAERRDAILEAAKRAFGAHGFFEASVQHIIEEAEIARGTFYLYFASKRDVFHELLEEFLALLRGSVRRISLDPQAGPAIEQLRANFHRVFRVVFEHRDVASIMLRDPSAFDEESRDEAERFDAQIRAMIEGAIRVGQQLRVIRDCDVELAAIAAFGVLRATLRRVLDAPPTDRGSARLRPETVADELMAFIIEGLAEGSDLRAAGRAAIGRGSAREGAAPRPRRAR